MNEQGLNEWWEKQCRKAFEEWATSGGATTSDVIAKDEKGSYKELVTMACWYAFQAAWNSRPESGSVGSVPSEPTLKQYHDSWDEDDKDDDFGRNAWGDNEEATMVDQAHAEGFRRGWKTLHALLSTAHRGEVDWEKEAKDWQSKFDSEYRKHQKTEQDRLNLENLVSVLKRMHRDEMISLQEELEGALNHRNELQQGMDRAERVMSNLRERLDNAPTQPKDDAHRGEVESWRKIWNILEDIPVNNPYSLQIDAIFAVVKPFVTGGNSTPFQPREVSREDEIDYFVGGSSGKGLIRIEQNGHHIALILRGEESEAWAKKLVDAYNQSLHISPAPGVAEAVEWINLAREGVKLLNSDAAVQVTVLQDLSAALSSLGVKS